MKHLLRIILILALVAPAVLALDRDEIRATGSVTPLVFLPALQDGAQTYVLTIARADQAFSVALISYDPKITKRIETAMARGRRIAITARFHPWPFHGDTLMFIEPTRVRIIKNR